MNAHDEATLDPDDWSAARALAHRAVDEAIDHLASVRERPAWREPPVEVHRAFDQPLPQGPTPLAEVYREFSERVRPYPMGNIHPRFWAWFMGAGSFTGALADFLAAVDGSNLGGGHTAPALVDRQVVRWLREAVGFPDSASGTLTNGGSAANLVALTVARNAKAGVDVRAVGVMALPKPLRFYASDQVHSCHQKALEVLGLGRQALHLVATDAAQRIDLAALKAAVDEDRAAGLQPAAVIASAGTVNTGAVDDLRALGAFCRREGLWFHVDGCIGALLRIAPKHRHLVDGIEAADSVALDPHKWLHAPFDVGCALVRDAQAHHGSFALHPEYLEQHPRGIAGAPHLFDYGIELSRSFRALKVWMMLKEHGIEAFGRLIDQNIAQAKYLAQRIEAEPRLELMAPVATNIVCFRHRLPGGDEAAHKRLNTEILLRIQESGLAVPTDTTLAGRHALRVAIANHRTRRGDLDMLVDAVLHHGALLQNAAA
ncbi:MAG: aspartate aminotransferase family protein [Piscinibacter sp.]|uniref:pyridoxal phosphate-dependent decarboxylase family protein n=1 Tax=Piscinibacter sp. TaxID=1903157 RepID=UPI003D1111E9